MVKARLALASASALAMSCALVAGIHDRDFQVAAVEAGADAEASTPLRCAHTSPPGAPASGTSADLGPTLVFAVRSLDLSGNPSKPGEVGFDLDGVCTCDPNDGTRRDGGSSCALPATPLVSGACDAPGGVDNAFASVYAKFINYPQGEQFPALLNQSLDCGKQTLLLVVGGYNGQADDPQVTVLPIFSRGIREAHDGGAYPDAGCGGGTIAPWPARWDGQDRWSVPSGVFARLGAAEPVAIAKPLGGWVRNWRLVVDQRDEPFAPPIPFIFANTSVLTSQTVVSARVVPLDASGRDVSDGGGVAASFQLVDGVLSGRSSAASILSALGSIRVHGDGDGGASDLYVCSPLLQGLYAEVKATACNARDVALGPDASVDDPCDSLSMAVQFTAEPAAIGSDYDVPVPDSGACGPAFRDGCE
jgi:hypothetical protein